MEYKSYLNLLTKKDKYNIHKFLGLYTILFYIYIIFDLYYSGLNGHLELHKKNNYLILSILPIVFIVLLLK